MYEPLETQLVPLLISVIGGGTIVPLAVRAWSARRTRKADAVRSNAQVEAIAAHAAVEAVEATRGATAILRAQIADGREEITALRAERAEEREEIKRLRARIRELTPPP